MRVSDYSAVPRKVWPGQWNPIPHQDVPELVIPCMLSHWLREACRICGLSANVLIDPEGTAT